MAAEPAGDETFWRWSIIVAGAVIIAGLSAILFVGKSSAQNTAASATTTTVPNGLHVVIGSAVPTPTVITPTTAKPSLIPLGNPLKTSKTNKDRRLGTALLRQAPLHAVNASGDDDVPDENHDAHDPADGNHNNDADHHGDHTAAAPDDHDDDAAAAAPDHHDDHDDNDDHHDHDDHDDNGSPDDDHDDHDDVAARPILAPVTTLLGL